MPFTTDAIRKRRMLPPGSRIPKPENFNPLRTIPDKSSYLDQTIGINIQNRWNFHKGSFMLGYEFQRDMQDRTINKPTSVKENFYDRNVHLYSDRWLMISPKRPRRI